MIFTIILLTALLNIILGFVVYNKNPKSDTHRLLSFLTVIFAAWTIANYYSLNSPTPEQTLFWIRAVMFITAPLGPVLFLFIKSFPNSKLDINQNIIKILVFLTLVVQALSFTRYIFSDVKITDQISPVPEFGIFLFAILFVGLPILSFIGLISKYKKSSGIEKLQLKYLISGITATFSLMIITNFISVVLFNYSELVIFGPIFSLIFVGFITYSIIKHRLLEVRVILVRSLIYTLSILFIAILYITAVFIASLYFFEIRLDILRVAIYATLALFASFTFVPLIGYFEKVSDRIFFKGKYDSTELTNKLIKNVASTIDIKKLTSKTLETLTLAMKISDAAIVVYNGKSLNLFSQSGYVLDRNKKTALLKLANTKKMIIFDEVTSKKIRNILRTLDISIYIPLYESRQKIGALMLGEKKTGQIYSSVDISVLQIFGPVIAVALRNAYSYERISRFNIILKKEIQKATKNLKKANDKLILLDKQKDEFMAIASHELKTPLSSVKLYSQLLKKRVEKSKDLKVSNFIGKIEGQINKLVNLINDLLDLSRIEEGKIRFNFINVGINKIIEEVTDEMQMIIPQKIILKLDKEYYIKGDLERLNQVLINLLSNASKYSRNTKQIIIASKLYNKKIVVSVEDFGSGLNKSEQKIVFERFNRAGQDGENASAGLGLGLYISKEIIQRHNGRIWVESKKNIGSKFYFSLPLVKEK